MNKNLFALFFALLFCACNESSVKDVIDEDPSSSFEGSSASMDVVIPECWL